MSFPTINIKYWHPDRSSSLVNEFQINVKSITIKSNSSSESHRSTPMPWTASIAFLYTPLNIAICSVQFFGQAVVFHIFYCWRMLQFSFLYYVMNYIGDWIIIKNGGIYFIRCLLAGVLMIKSIFTIILL